MDKLLNLSSDDLTELIRDALRTELYGENWQSNEDSWQVWVWRVYPFGSSVIYCHVETTYQRSYTLDQEELTITLGDDSVEVEHQDAWVPVKMSFSEDGSDNDVVDGDYVIKTWKLWEGGDYPDRASYYSESHVSAIARNTPQGDNERAGPKLKLEHVDLPLVDQKWFDQKCGIMSCFTRGLEIFGKVRVPKWLDDLYKSKGWKYSVSVGLTRARDAIEELSLCLWPRVEDAGGFTTQLRDAYAQFTSSKDAPRKEEPSPPTPKPIFGNPKNMKEALKLLFSKSDPNLLKECGLSVEELDKVEFTKPKEELPPQFAALEAGIVTTKAEAFFSEHAAKDANGVVHATSAMKAPILTIFRASLMADGENGKVKFSATDGMPTEGDTIAAFRNLLKEFRIPTGQGIPAFSSGGGENNNLNGAGLDFSPNSVRTSVGLKPNQEGK